MERALSQVADHRVEMSVAGRTDSGVHALAQVAHFDSDAPRSVQQWLRGVGSALPDDISVRWVQLVPQSFHARFAARSRTYIYLIANSPQPPALLHGRAVWERRPLDERAMQKAMMPLVGEHDFSAFRSSACDANSPMRRIYVARVSRLGELVLVRLRANAFLHHMVRNIAGSLLEVGRGTRPPEWMRELLAGGERNAAADTARACGLYFVRADYPAEYGLPRACAADMRVMRAMLGAAG